MTTIVSTAGPGQELGRFPRSPAKGKSGQATNVGVNLFIFTRFFTGNVDQYDIDIQPKCPRNLCRAVFEKFGQKHFPGAPVVFDGNKIAFAGKPIQMPAGGLKSEQPHPDGGKKPYTVTMRLASKINMQELVQFMERPDSQVIPPSQLQVLEVVVKSMAAMQSVTIGANRFFTRSNDGRSSIGGGLVCATGLFGAVVPTIKGLCFNIDLTTAAFWQNNSLVAIISEMLGTQAATIDPSRFNRSSKRRLMALKGIKISTNHRGDRPRVYTISRFTDTSARQATFNMEDQETGEKRTITVAQYFQEHYNKPLRFPNLPCVIIQKQGRDPMYLPIEICELMPYQNYKQQLQPEQLAEMIRFACKNPSQRHKFIMDGVSNQLLKLNSSIMREFGTEIDTSKMLSTRARQLQPPLLHYGGKKISPRDGTWNMRDQMLFKRCKLEAWCFIVVSDQRDYQTVVGSRQQPGFAQGLSKTGSDLGIQMPQKAPPIIHAPNMKQAGYVIPTLKACRDECLKTFNLEPQMIVVIYKDDDDHALYSMLKHVTETKIGVATQVINSKKIFNAKPQYFANVWLKMNAKLDGTNVCLDPQSLPMLQRPTMILGADVSHPGSDDPNTPSICALTASLDAPATRFSAIVSYQEGRMEIIKDLKAGVKKSLIRFYQTTRSKPERIIMFRDGVSEGQFQQVQKEEIAAIRAACIEIEANYTPTITFVVVLKRHHTRFFPEGRTTDRSGNPVAGLVVDDQVTSPHLFDFYLQSHSGLQGTCRPIHYYVLHDENKFDHDGIQTLCNNLSYSFARCTRSVKVVPSVYYAHLAAERATKWINGGYHLGNSNYPDPSVNSVRSGVSKDSKDSKVDFSWCPIVHPNQEGRMWFI